MSMFGIFGKSATIRSGKFDLTPRLVDLGDRLIPLAQVSSLAIDNVRPWRGVAGTTGLIGAVLAVRTLSEANFGRLSSGADLGGLITLSIGLLMLVLAAVLWLRRSPRLVIVSSAAERVEIGADLALLRAVLDRLRMLMLLDPDRDLRFVVDLDAETIGVGAVIDRRLAAVIQEAATAAAEPPPEPRTSGRGATRGRPAQGGQSQGQGSQGLGPGMPGGGLSGPVGAGDLDPHGQGLGAPGPAAYANLGPQGLAQQGLAQQGLAQQGLAQQGLGQQGLGPQGLGGAGAAGSFGGPPGPTTGGRGSNAAAQAPPGSIEQLASTDVAELIAFIERRDIVHKADLVQLLAAVQSHLAAGPARRGDAQAAWRSFSDYAGKYLGHVDGLLVLVERIGRVLL